MKHYGHGKGWEQSSKHVMRAIGPPDYHKDDQSRKAKLREIEADRRSCADWLSEKLAKFEPDREQNKPSLLTSRKQLEASDSQFYIMPDEERIVFRASTLSYEFGTKKVYDEIHSLVTPFIDERAKKEAYFAKSQDALKGLDIGLLDLIEDKNQPDVPLSQIVALYHGTTPVFRTCTDIGATSLNPIFILDNQGLNEEWKETLDKAWEAYLSMCP
tara:strand:- start:750 stop:1394 length:645 start_codon:yes stop_codon:yes gene_type:complete